MTSTNNRGAVPTSPQQLVLEVSSATTSSSVSVIKSPHSVESRGAPVVAGGTARTSPIISSPGHGESVASLTRNYDLRGGGRVDYLLGTFPQQPQLQQISQSINPFQQQIHQHLNQAINQTSPYQPAGAQLQQQQLLPFSVPGGALNLGEQQQQQQQNLGGYLPPAKSLSYPSHGWQQQQQQPSPGSFRPEEYKQLPQVTSLVMPSVPLDNYYNRTSTTSPNWQHNYPASSGSLPSVNRLASPQQFAGSPSHPTQWNQQQQQQQSSTSYLFDQSGPSTSEGFSKGWDTLPFNPSASPGSPHSIPRTLSRSSQDLLRAFPELLDPSLSGGVDTTSSVIKSVHPKLETPPPTSTTTSPAGVIIGQNTRRRSQSAVLAAMVKKSQEEENAAVVVDAMDADEPPAKKPKKKWTRKLKDHSAETIYVPSLPAAKTALPEGKSAKKTRMKKEGVVEDGSSSAESSEAKSGDKTKKKKKKKYVKPVARIPPEPPILPAAAGYSLRNKVPVGITFAEGERLEACDETKTWYKAKIVQVNQDAGQIYVHFEGWNTRYDEWLPMFSKRIRPLTEEKFSEHQERYNIGDYLIARWSCQTSKPGIVVEVQTDPEKYVILYHDGAKRLVTNKGLRRMSPVLRERFANQLQELVAVASTYPLLQDSPSDLEASPLSQHDAHTEQTLTAVASAPASGNYFDPAVSEQSSSSADAAINQSTATIAKKASKPAGRGAAGGRGNSKRAGAAVEMVVNSSELLITSASKPRRQPKKPWKLEDNVEIVSNRKKRRKEAAAGAEAAAADQPLNVQDVPTEREPSSSTSQQPAPTTTKPPLSTMYPSHISLHNPTPNQSHQNRLVAQEPPPLPPHHEHPVHDHIQHHKRAFVAILESPLFRMSPPTVDKSATGLEPDEPILLGKANEGGAGLVPEHDSMAVENEVKGGSVAAVPSTIESRLSSPHALSTSTIHHFQQQPAPVLKSMLRSPEHHPPPIMIVKTEPGCLRPATSPNVPAYSFPIVAATPTAAAVAPPKVDSRGRVRKRPVPKPPAPKELVVSLDHNEFKCTVSDCHKSFRKQKLLHDHLRHYHHVTVEEEVPVVMAPPPVTEVAKTSVATTTTTTAASKKKRTQSSVEESPPVVMTLSPPVVAPSQQPPVSVATAPMKVSQPGVKPGKAVHYAPTTPAVADSSLNLLSRQLSGPWVPPPGGIPGALPEAPNSSRTNGPFFGQGFGAAAVATAAAPYPAQNYGYRFPESAAAAPVVTARKEKQKQPKRESIAAAVEGKKSEAAASKRKESFKKGKQSSSRETSVAVGKGEAPADNSATEPSPRLTWRKRAAMNKAKRLQQAPPEALADTDDEDQDISQYIQNDHELVHCKCNYELENGFMVQCELCATWQHGTCYEMEDKFEVPLHYICDFCRTPKAVRSSQRNICHDLQYLRAGRLAEFFPLEEDVEELAVSAFLPSLPAPSGLHQSVDRPLYRDLAADTIACNDQLKTLKRVSRALMAAEECEAKSSLLLSGICRTHKERVKLNNLIQSLPKDVVRGQDLNETLRRLTLVPPAAEAIAPVPATVVGGEVVPTTIEESSTISPAAPLTNGYSYESFTAYSPEIPESRSATASVVVVEEDPSPTNATPTTPLSQNPAASSCAPISATLLENWTALSPDSDPTDEEVERCEVQGVLAPALLMDSAEATGGGFERSHLAAEPSPKPQITPAPVPMEPVGSPEISATRPSLTPFSSSIPDSMIRTDAEPEVKDERTEAAEVTSMDGDVSTPKKKPEEGTAVAALPALQDIDPEIMALCQQADVATVLLAVSSRDDILAKYLEEIESHILEMEKQCDSKYGTKFATTPELAQKDLAELQDKLYHQQSDLRNLERLGYVVSVEPREKTVRQMPGPLPIPSSTELLFKANETRRPPLPTLKIRLGGGGTNGKPKKPPTKPRPSKMMKVADLRLPVSPATGGA
ncbi:hypothetical protein BV898_03801 [Hypsibius exemplaris]|uniref:C2H2-type domain-containing protein n=1 Tax=Hypsibius exemplaris TaxID=2072580 RepID=A0A1W0X4H6_HYPEX|nr:hypothetical protein BV898_03801 [Hypsibius exemplaris]